MNLPTYRKLKLAATGISALVGIVLGIKLALWFAQGHMLFTSALNWWQSVLLMTLPCALLGAILGVISTDIADLLK